MSAAMIVFHADSATCEDRDETLFGPPQFSVRPPSIKFTKRGGVMVRQMSGNTGKWTERLRVPTTGLLTRNNFRVAKNNRSTLFDTVTLIESNSLAG
jgi:hypothetical protein